MPSVRGAEASVPGGVDPLGQRVDDGPCDDGRTLDHDGGRPDLADHRRHPRLAKLRAATCRGCRRRAGRACWTAPGGAVRPAVVPRARSSGSRRSRRTSTRRPRPAGAHVDLGAGGVGLGRLDRPVRVVVGGDQGALAHQEAADGAHRGAQAALLAEGDPSAGQGARRLAEPLAVRTAETSSDPSWREPKRSSSDTVVAPAIPSTGVRRSAGTRPGPPR